MSFRHERQLPEEMAAQLRGHSTHHPPLRVFYFKMSTTMNHSTIARSLVRGIRLLEIALLVPPRSPELRLAWSRWRRARRKQARRSHYRRRGVPWPETGIHRICSP
jgi:hypothetical protein